PPGPRRWDGWARALAGRFRAGRLRRPGAELVLHRLAGGQSGGLVERIFERTLVMRTALFVPRLHLTIAPLVRSGEQTGTRPMALPRGAAAGGTVRPAERRGGSPAPLRYAVPRMEPLARALARSGPAALPAGPALLLAAAERHRPRVSSSAPLVLAGRVAAQGQRHETPLPRPATTLQRPPAPPPPAEVSAQAHRPFLGSPAIGAALPAGAPGLPATPGELDRLTEQVIRRIDRRMDVWRERTGRVR
ncbi:MAG: hypothetical protein ACJ76N_24515, partial [Thermoanaerobaculia bacterium]